jgi:hypothetical protein
VANEFITPSIIARTALSILTRQIVLPSLVWRDFDTEFNGRIGETVTVRVPAYIEAEEIDIDDPRNADITTSDVEESSFPVELTKYPYSAVPVIDEDFDLRIEDFAEQVLLPQTRAVAEKIEGYLAATMTSATYETSLELDTTNPFNTIVDARKALNDANVPLGDRYLAVGSEVEAHVLKSELFHRADQSGGTSALREAVIGRVAGFTVVSSNALESDEAYAFHKSAYVLATRAPGIPAGVTAGSSASNGGLAMRWIRDYEANRLRDRSVVGAYAGTRTVLDGGDLVRSVQIVASGS